MSRLIYVVLFVGLVPLAAWADTNDVCHVGVQLHLRPDAASDPAYLRHARAFVENGMADYVFLVAQALPTEQRERLVRYLADHKVHFLMQESFPTSPEWFSSKNSARRYSADDYRRIRDIAGDLFLGVHQGELDSTGLPPEMYLPKDVLSNPTRAKIKEAFVKRLEEGLDRFRAQYGVPWAHSSALLDHHLFAEAGVSILCSEIGENIPNVSMIIASNRGAARAYRRPWMIDHSTWWAPRGNVGEQVSPREGHTPWCFFTSLLIAAMGGADYAQLEVDWAAYDQNYKLLPWGQALKNLYAVTRVIGPRGNTVTRFAVLIGHDNGWPGVGWRLGDVRATGLFDGLRHQFLQTRDADLSMKIFDVFYPGFERCGWDGEYPGFFAESPLGTLDIVADNLPAEAYSRYACLVALGYHRMNERLRDHLRAYVERGGVLVCGDSLFLDEHESPLDADFAEPLIGCKVDGSEAKLIRLQRPQGSIEEVEGYLSGERTAGQEWQNHWLHPVQLTAGRVVARLGDTPYIVANRIGKGRVFYITALNLVGSSAQKRGPEPFLFANTLYRFLHTLANHIGDGIRLAPWTSLERIFNERPDGTGMLLVLNHGDMSCRRDAILKNSYGFTSAQVVVQGTWESWHPGGPVTCSRSGATLAWTFSMSPKSFVLFRFMKQRQVSQR